MKKDNQLILSLLISTQLDNNQTRNTVPGHSETAVSAGEGTFEIQHGGDKGDVFCSGLWSRDNVWSNNIDFSSGHKCLETLM